MSILENKMIKKYVKENFEYSESVNYLEWIEENKDVETYLYEDLPNHEISGFPFASDLVDKDGNVYSMNDLDKIPNGKKVSLRYHFLPNYHELYIGTTGSGKTTGCIMPQLRAICSIKNKPNLFLTDPKGELFDTNATYIKKMGYQLYVLNFKDVTCSDYWNPLHEIYDRVEDLKNISSIYDVVPSAVPDDIPKVKTSEPFNEKEFILYDNMAFPSYTCLHNYIECKKAKTATDFDVLINEFTHTLISVESVKDPTWEMGAQSLLRGLLYCMVDDIMDPNVIFTKDMMNIKTINSYYLSLRDFVIKDCNSLASHPLMRNKSKVTISFLATALNNAPVTMKGYCGTFESKLTDWFQGHIYALTTANSVDLDKDDSKPFAIFVITRDYEKSDFDVAGLFIDWVYRQLIKKNENGYTRPTYFLLDEFGNVPAIRDFENKIATARSRNIWFHLVLQSYSQLEMIYGDSCSSIIRDNCNSQYFLGSQNYATKERFSTECGTKQILDPMSLMNNVFSLTTAKVVPVSKLDLIEPGEIYIKRIYTPVILSRFIRSYVCKSLGIYENFENGLLYETPHSYDSYTNVKYFCPSLNRWIGRDPYTKVVLIEDAAEQAEASEQDEDDIDDIDDIFSDFFKNNKPE